VDRVVGPQPVIRGVRIGPARGGERMCHAGGEPAGSRHQWALRADVDPITARTSSERAGRAGRAGRQAGDEHAQATTGRTPPD
jgi:hypothetical protein